MPSMFERGLAMWAPYVEVFESSSEFVVDAELPGLKKEEITLEITDGMLAISGERKRQEEKTEEGLCRSEWSYGSFLRTIALPEGAKTDEATATFNDGCSQ